MKIKSFLVIVISLYFLSSCKTVNYNLRSKIYIEDLNIRVKYDSLVPDTIKKTFDNKLNDLIEKRNSEYHKFRLVSVEDTNVRSLVFYVKDNKLVSNSTQVISSVITILGISMPVLLISAQSPIIIFFYFIPKDVSNIDLRLSKDLTYSKLTHKRRVVNSGYLRNRNKQIFKHGEAFSKLVEIELDVFEKQYIKTVYNYKKKNNSDLEME